MGGLFGGGNSTPPPAPEPPPAPLPAPTIDVARSSRQQQDTNLSRRGRAATVLTSAKGDMTETKTASKTLLGS